MPAGPEAGCRTVPKGSEVSPATGQQDRYAFRWPDPASMQPGRFSQKPADNFHMPSGGTTIIPHQLQTVLAKYPPQLGTRDQSPAGFYQTNRRFDLNTGAVLQHQSGDLPEIGHVWSKNTGHTHRGRLQQVVSAGRHQTPPDKNNIGHSVKVHQLANRIHKKNLSALKGTVTTFIQGCAPS